MARHPRSAQLALGAVALVVLSPMAQSMDFGDMFNPGRWFGGNDDYYYEDGPWGGYGPYGPYAPYGYGAPGYSPYGAPGYGYAPAPGYAAPGYAAPPAPAAAPSTTTDGAKDREIEALKQRIEQLENRQGRVAPRAPVGTAPGGDAWPAAPAFRPVEQY